MEHTSKIVAETTSSVDDEKVYFLLYAEIFYLTYHFETIILLKNNSCFLETDELTRLLRKKLQERIIIWLALRKLNNFKI